MPRLLLFEPWPAGIVRIAILVAVGWCFSIDTVHAELPVSLGWPSTGFDNTLVDLAEIQSGGPPRDGISLVDDPKFDSVGDANAWLNPREPVVVVTIDGETKAYPIQRRYRGHGGSGFQPPGNLVRAG